MSGGPLAYAAVVEKERPMWEFADRAVNREAHLAALTAEVLG
jgi:hypothetical protein